MMTDQEQWKQDFERARHYRDALDEIAGMKIPYCDAYDVANSMRDVAKEAIQNFMPEESHLWARISDVACKDCLCKRGSEACVEERRLLKLFQTEDGCGKIDHNDLKGWRPAANKF